MDCCRLATDRYPTPWLAILAASLVALSLSSGCDDKSNNSIPPPDPPSTKAAADNYQRPTTQQILSARRKPLELLTFPLTIEVPDLPSSNSKSPQWKISSTATDSSASLSVEGPGPSGDVMIQMAPLPSTHKASFMQGVEKSALKDRAEHPDTVLFADARSIGPIRVVEQRILRHMAAREIDVPRPNSQETDRQKVPASDSVEWSVMLFIPAGKDYTVGTLTFIDLTKEQYDKDKNFLEQLVNSLHYDGSKGELP